MTNVLGIVVVLAIVAVLTMMFLPAVNSAGTPQPEPAPALPSGGAAVSTPLGDVPAGLVALGVALVLIGVCVGIGLALAFVLRAAQAAAQRGGTTSPLFAPDPPRAPPAPKAAVKDAAKAAPAPPSRVGRIAGAVFGLVVVLGLIALAANNVMRDPQAFSTSATLFSATLPAWAAALLVFAVLVVLAAVLGAVLAGLLFLFDRVNRRSSKPAAGVKPAAAPSAPAAESESP